MFFTIVAFVALALMAISMISVVPEFKMRESHPECHLWIGVPIAKTSFPIDFSDFRHRIAKVERAFAVDVTPTKCVLTVGRYRNKRGAGIIRAVAESRDESTKMMIQLPGFFDPTRICCLRLVLGCSL